MTPSEDLVHMVHEMGIEMGVNPEMLIECARLAQELVGRPLEGHVAKSGPVNHTGTGTACG
jgi:hydroxymethylglutaryl-CoA lyase